MSFGDWICRTLRRDKRLEPSEVKSTSIFDVLCDGIPTVLIYDWRDRDYFVNIHRDHHILIPWEDGYIRIRPKDDSILNRMYIGYFNKESEIAVVWHDRFELFELLKKALRTPINAEQELTNALDQTR